MARASCDESRLFIKRREPVAMKVGFLLSGESRLRRKSAFYEVARAGCDESHFFIKWREPVATKVDFY